MRLTVEEALTIYPLSKAKLVAGSKGIGRIITSLNTMDAPDVFDWIKSGEMLFTTAFAIKDTPDSFLQMLRKLDERGAAGIGIKLGRYWSEIPDIVLEEADRMHFPILELPYEFTFSDQMNALFHAEFQRSTEKLHDALEKQKQLVRFALQTQSFADPFQKVADILARPLAVVNARGQILLNASGWPEAELLASWPWPPKLSRIESERGWTSRIPLTKEADCYGFLLVMSDDPDALQEEEGLLHQAAEILSHHMSRLDDDQQTIASYQWGTLIERYVQRQIPRDTFQEQARTIGSPGPAGPFVCVVTIPSADSSPESARDRFHDFRREIKYHLHLGTLESRQHVLFRDRLLSVFQMNDGASSGEAFMNLVVKSFDDIHRTQAGDPLRSYVSKVKLELPELLEAYEECTEAKKIADALSFHSPVVPFANLELSYVFRYIPNDIMKRYCDNVLRPLQSKDEEYRTYMLSTLECYFANEGQINEVAKQMFIHRNTVLYRLEKMSELLGLDLRKMGDLLKLKLLFMFKRLMTTNDYNA
ncbi:PucR family transcriptional regulator ligand-binding domain-containing protein [Paenibacillus sp.]|uniref:PucR family transcriptional regulator n=1 Tax=Paenibacillus sp. TaxID=58172 RepID=UPI00281201B1|nr:PucR family transcriptional regulator ligand-binding domain-containing protein [Paenibacillus sp.]